MYFQPDVKFQQRLAKWSNYLMWAVAFIAISVLLSWQLSITTLKGFLSILTTMNPVTAVSFIFSVVSFRLLTAKNSSKQKNFLGKTFAFLVLIVGVLKLLTFFQGFTFEVDRILFTSKLEADNLLKAPNRMAPNTAILFMLVGITLLLLHVETKRKQMPAHYIAIIIGIGSLFSLIGYLYQVQSFYGLRNNIPMAIHTASSFLMISAAVLFAQPDKGVMKEFTSVYTGSITARLLIPTAILLPIMLGLLRLYGGWAGLYNNEFGAAIFAVLIILTFLGVAWYNTRLLNKRDIQKAEAEMALKESEEQIQAIFRAAPDAVIVINENGEIVQWNLQSEILFGWTAEEVTGKLFSDMVLPEQYRLAHQNALYRFVKTGESSILNKSFEIKALKKDNTEFHAALSISPTMLKDSYLFIGFIRDITERKKMENQLKRFNEDLQEQVKIRTDEIRESEEKYRTLVEQAADAIFINDQQGNLVDVNTRACKMLGYAKEQLLKMNISNLYTATELAQKPIMYKELRSGERTDVERNMLHSNGSMIPVNITAQMISSGLIMAIARDITEYKKLLDELRIAKESYFSLMSNIDGIVWEADAKTFQFTFVSKQAERLLKYPTEQWIQEPTFWKDHIHPEDQNWAVNYCVQCTLEKKAHEFEYRMIAADGRVIWLRDIVTVQTANDEAVKLTGIMVDITEKKKAEEEIKERAIQLHTLSNNLPGMMTYRVIREHDGKMRFSYVSESVKQFTGKTPEEIIQNPDILYKLILEEDRERFSAAERESFNNLSVFDVEIRSKNSSGQIRWLHVRSVPRKLNDGRVIWDGVHTDITERKLAEKILEEKEQQLRLFVENSPAALVMMDRDMKYIITSKRWMVDYNLGDMEVIGKSHYEIFPEIPQRWKDIHQRCLAGVIEKEDEDMFVRADGSIDWVRWEIHPWYKYSGEIGGIIMFTEVITDRKKAELRLAESERNIRHVISSSSDSFYVIDKNCTITLINKEASSNLEKAWGKPVTVGTNILDMIPDETDEPIRASLEKVFSGEKVEYELFVSHKDMAPWWLVNYMPVFDEEGLVTGAYISTKNISSRKKTDELLKESYEDIRRLASHIEKVRELERIDIAREIHDELGQQLTVLKMDVSWLNKKLENKDEKIEQKMTQLLQMIDSSVKTVRKISADLRPSALDDLGLIAALEWHSLEFEKRSGIKVVFTPGINDLKLPAEIATPLFRVFQESLTNVARHAKASKIETALRAGNGKLIMTISDDGKGFVVEGIENKKTLGILGMRERISLMKGECNITSIPEKGTKIEIIVPVSSSN